MKNSILVLGTKNLNNSLSEIKEYLNFTLVFYDKISFLEPSIKKINSVLVDSEICNEVDILYLVRKLKNKPILLLKKKKLF